MRRRVARLAAACNHDALFAQLYLRTTEAFWAAARAGRFRHRATMAHFDAWFARYYLRAYDVWHSSRRSSVPGAWQVAFGNSAGRAVRGIGNLLIGMNAHISRDLAHTVADLATGPGARVDPDFALFTRVIQSIAGQAIAEIATRFDPTVALARIPVALGPKSFGAVIALWRTEAWRNGIALRDARGAARAAVDRRIEATSVLRADAIVAGTAYLPLVQSSRSRDVYCAAHTGR
jgi:Family of unknown function (DUF5995)